MVTILLEKVVFMLLTMFISLGLIPEPAPAADTTADLAIVFENEEAGSAAGTVDVTANYFGAYDLYWGDADYEKLTVTGNGITAPYSEFATVEVFGGQGSKSLNAFLAIPAGAETVLVYKSDMLVGKEELPDEKVFSGEATYSFGSLSDLHFNRYDNSDTDDVATGTFPTALAFLDAFDVTMVAMPGDISNNGERDSYEKFNSIAAQFDFPVYTCKGNHDCYDEFNLTDWQELMNTGVYGEEKREGVLAVADNGLDFVFAGPETHGDIFIFFSQVKADYVLFSSLVTQEQLDWLAAQFETYKDKNVYLFFHTFLTAPTGHPNMCEGNLVNKAGAFYPLPYPLGGADEARFRELLQTYKNVTFFNGHSHWSYDMQKYNDSLNISDYDGTTATMVHVSSVSAPRTGTDFSLIWTSNAGTMSEGAFVSVFGDRMVVTAVDFINGEFLAYATYRIKH